MIIEELTHAFGKDQAEYKLKLAIEKAKKHEELQTREHQNTSTYVNPCKLRIGYNSTQKQKQGKIFYYLKHRDYCPV